MDEQSRLARAAARRAAARLHHPDLGGDPVVFTAALAAIDKTFTPPAERPTLIARHPRRSTLLQLARDARQTLARSAAWIDRGGKSRVRKRRYFEI